MFRRWVDDHFKLVRAFLLILAALNILVSYTLFTDHPIMAAANATMALILAVGVIMSWRSP
jgi:membrane protein CcdC involved in cytochrome C biogenesis